LFIGVSVFAWVKDGNASAEWPMWAHLVLAAMVVLGASLIGVGLFADDHRAEKWANDASSAGLGILVVMVIAFPIYLFLSFLKRYRRHS
jgi:hypothetical protein